MVSKPASRRTLRAIRLLLLDVDGVMTDGGIYFSERGDEIKKFDIHDGYGIARLRKLGVQIGILTGRTSRLLLRRAQELGITEVYQNVEDKLDTYEHLKRKLNITDAEVAYVGDDEPDIPVMRKVGFSACPSNAMAIVRKEVDFICKNKGGEGAVREVADLILASRAATK